MFTRLLIANRGEIACRVIATARRMGLSTVAVHSQADARARHVRLADQAICIGPAAARDSYLDGARILKAAADCGADAIHPGYGFLSENPGFAEAVAAAGLVFVGPPAAAMRAMADKGAAKSLMEKAGVPVLPGYHGADQSDAALSKAAAKMGFPLLIKPAAGGGGKGMRVVEKAADLPAALSAARREAAGAFGDDRLLLERYLTRPRHVEIQVFADSHGNAIHLFERDCSLQRRHQKVVEEAPAPGLPDALRARMGGAAVAAARAVDYRGAGTVEFLLDGDEFWFMEMNTRLQVEHPVTELVTGQDLVEWQLRVAAGQPLKLTQDQLRINGHAIEARLYAEDPARGFLPQIGRLALCDLPTGLGIRVDTGVEAGDEVTPHYDPMLAKIIAHGPDRATALARLREALANTRIAPLATNRDWLLALLGHPAFAAADLATDFIARHADDLAPADPAALAPVAVLLLLALRAADEAARPGQSADPFSPWRAGGGWRLNLPAGHQLRLGQGDDVATIALRAAGDGVTMDFPAGPVTGQGALLGDHLFRARIGAAEQIYGWLCQGADIFIIGPAGSARFADGDRLSAHGGAREGAGGLKAPMPGRVIAVMAGIGDVLAEGDPILVLEAMKMEHVIRAPAAGRVQSLPFAVGDMVSEGVALATLAEDAA